MGRSNVLPASSSSSSTAAASSLRLSLVSRSVGVRHPFITHTSPACSPTLHRRQIASRAGLVSSVHTGNRELFTIKPDGTNKPVHCSYIEYFTGESDRDGLAPTEAILLSMKRSTVFPLVSLMVLLIGGIMCFVGHCNSRRNLLTFISGILFVLAGLSTLVGIILYIGSITEEVGNKPKITVEAPRFVYSYGSSFMMAVGSFSLTELSGVLSVYLYISRHRHIQRKNQQQQAKDEANDRGHHWRHRKGRCQARDRSQSRERSSRDPSLSRSESYFTYTPVSDTSHELSNYTFGRESSRNTISTTAETHMVKEHSTHSVDLLRRTTPV